MKTVTGKAKTLIALLAVFAAGSAAYAQDGLAGELDDLLGLGDEAQEEPAKAEPAAKVEEAVAEAKEEVKEAVEEAKEEVAEAVEEKAEVAEEKAEEAVAEAKEEVKEAVEEAKEAVAEAVEEKAEAAEEKAEEAVAEAKEEVKEEKVANLDDLLAPAEDEAPVEKDEEAKAEVEETKKEVAEAVEEKAEAAEAKAEEAVAEVKKVAKEEEPVILDDLVAPADGEVPAEKAEVAEEKAEAAEEKAEEAVAEVKEEAKEEKVATLDDLLAPAEDVADDVAEAAVPVEEVKEEVAEVADDAAEAAPEVAEEVEAEEVAPIVAEAAPAADAADDIDAIVSETFTLEKMRREALEKHGISSLEVAKKELKAGNYKEALEKYQEAVKYITRRDDNIEIIDEAEKGVAEALYRQAVLLRKQENRNEALQVARQAREKNHPKASKLIAEIEDEINNPPAPPKPKEAKRWKDDSFVKNKESVRHDILKAREYLITGEIDKAKAELELILKDNPYEEDAIILLRRISESGYDFSSEEFKTTRTRMVEDVRSAWTPRRYGINVPSREGKGDADSTVGKPVGEGGKTVEQLTAEKMKSIVIPAIEFESVPINDVIAFFRDQARANDDPNIPPEQRGVNLILKLPASQQPAAAEIDDSNPFASSGASDNAGGIPPVTLNARYMTLYDALTYVADLTSLKFRIRGNVVVILPLNEPDANMVSRSYTVLPSIEERASSVSASIRQSSPFGEDSDEEPAAADGQVDWKQLFTDMGVEWPNGSSIKYLRSINKIRVLNTPENLEEFEKALDDLNVTPRQIEIEARFVEVSQTDLESLGFEWLLNDNYKFAQKKNDMGQYIQMDRGSGSIGNRYLDNMTDGGLRGAYKLTEETGVSDGILKFSSVLTNPEISFVLHALSQRTNTDLLSAPKVVATHAQEASIEVVREYIYPTEFEVKENDLDTGDSDTIQVTYPMVEPQEFDMRKVGVILHVVPEVSEDGQMIDLQLNPEIVSEPEFKDWGFDYPNPQDPSTPYHLAMPQPIFETRTISTKISIFNGATVVMGGMITEQRTECEDKVPFLGDIPLIGRLFRSKSERSEKRNLLVFVTARMVDPAGRTLKADVLGGDDVKKGE